MKLEEYYKILPDGKHEIYDKDGRVIAIVEVKDGKLIHIEREDT